MTNRYITRPTQWLVVPENEPSLYNENALIVSIDDEGGGEYVRIKSQSGADTGRSISFEREAWPAIQQAVNCAVHQINQYESESND